MPYKIKYALRVNAMPHKWDRHAIKAEIHRRGMTLTRLAQQAGVESSACRAALIRPNIRGERIISDFLGIPRHILWPDRYRQDSGTSRRRRQRRGASGGRRIRGGQKKAAARPAKRTAA